MNPDFLFRLLAWSLAVNYGILLLWFLAFVFARNYMQRIHGRWFKLSDSTFATVHYSGMAGYKIAILIFNLAPLLALWLASGGS